MGACHGKSIPTTEFSEEEEARPSPLRTPTHHHRLRNSPSRTTPTHVRTPPHLTRAPSRNARTPSHHASTPSHHARTPSHHARTPSHHARTPSHHARAASKAEGESVSKGRVASPFIPFYSPSPAHGLFSFAKKSPPPGDVVVSGRSSSRGGGGGSSSATPKRHFKLRFAPPSPAKHIRAALARRHGTVKPNVGARESQEGAALDGLCLDKNFGFSRNFASRFELGKEVGRGHFGYTCEARVRKGQYKNQVVAVKVIAKAKMSTAIAIEDVRREVKILRDLTGHPNLVQFHNAYEDGDNVYIIMEFCEGGELLDRILSRGGKYSEDDAKVIMVQILNVVAYCHLQGVVHRDLKPENFLFTTKDENSQLKVIDFGLSDFVKPDEKLNDIVGSAYYVAPEVLHRSYSTEADVWSIGVIAYILLCGSRPFWARTESGIFRAVLKADPSFDEAPWPFLSYEAKDFVKRLLSKDPRRRMSAAQALSHRWLRSSSGIKMPVDILLFRLMKGYLRSSSLRKDALRALSKTLTIDELFHLKEQFALLDPNKNGYINLQNIQLALVMNATELMDDSCAYYHLVSLSSLQFRKMDFDEFCAATVSVHQLESLSRWEQHARCAYEIFENDGNRSIVIDELASELGLGPSVPLHAVLNDWIRHIDGKLSLLGFVKLLHGPSSHTLSKIQGQASPLQ